MIGWRDVAGIDVRWSLPPLAARVGLPADSVASVEEQRQRSSGDIDVFSPEEVMALVRAAASEHDARSFYGGVARACSEASFSRGAGETLTSPAP